MCVQPTIFADFRGLSSPALLRRAIIPGISAMKANTFGKIKGDDENGRNVFGNWPCSAISISLRPKACWLMFLTQKSENPEELFCNFSLGDTSSSSEELPVYDAATREELMRPMFGTVPLFILNLVYSSHRGEPWVTQERKQIWQMAMLLAGTGHTLCRADGGQWGAARLAPLGASASARPRRRRRAGRAGTQQAARAGGQAEAPHLPVLEAGHALPQLLRHLQHKEPRARWFQPLFQKANGNRVNFQTIIFCSYK